MRLIDADKLDMSVKVDGDRTLSPISQLIAQTIIQNAQTIESDGDCISREPFTDSTICEGISCNECSFNRKDKGGCILEERVKALPSVQPKTKTGHCKDCKYFEYDSWAKVDGIPLIVAHEICKKWGDGCKTSEDGYCFLFEPQERSDKE